MPIGIVAILWVAFINVILVFPPDSATTAENMSECFTPGLSYFDDVLNHVFRRLRGSDNRGRVPICFHFMGGLRAQMVHRPNQEHRPHFAHRGREAIKCIWLIRDYENDSRLVYQNASEFR